MQQYKKTWQKTKSKITAGQLMFFCMSLPAVPAGASQSSKAIKKVRNGHFLKLSCRVSDKTLPEPAMNYSFEAALLPLQYLISNFQIV